MFLALFVVGVLIHQRFFAGRPLIPTIVGMQSDNDRLKRYTMQRVVGLGCHGAIVAQAPPLTATEEYALRLCLRRLCVSPHRV